MKPINQPPGERGVSTPRPTCWPMVRLGDMLKRRSPDISVEPTENYPFAGVYCFGRGVFRGQERRGSEFAYKQLTRLRQGEFVYPKLMAWEGAFGVVPANCDGCYVSPEFPVFEVDTTRLATSYLHFYFQIPRVWEAVSGGSTGTNVRRRRLNPSDFLQREIPLPPLAEQRRVVARIEELAAQIHEARTLRQQATHEAEALVGAKASSIFRAAIKRGTETLDSLATLVRGKFTHRPRNEPRFFNGSHPWIQIGEIERADKFIREWTQTLNDEGLAISKKFPRGTVLISIAATIGAVGILDFDCCVPDSSVGVTPSTRTGSEFLYHYLRYLRGHLEEIAPQSAQKNINLQILTKLPVPSLPLAEQRRIVAELDALQAEVDALARLQAETAAELDALLPAILDRAFKGEL